MKKITRIIVLCAAILSAAILVSSCKLDAGQSTESMSFGFNDAEAIWLGYVNPEKPEEGVNWQLHFYSEGLVEAYFTIVTEECYEVPAGTFKCAKSLPAPVNTYLPGSLDKDMKPIYSYAITGSDGQYTCYSLITDGSFELKFDKDKNEYTLNASLFSYSIVVSMSYKGEIKYPNGEEEL